MIAAVSGNRVTAVLGPTNTGKTWYAIDRMLGHRTGMIGLPLRLLAREVYDRVREARGPSCVALVTGEERIIPKQARYWVCTVEAMPQASGVDFLAVDEIQLCGDAERGHIFTQRLLSARGQVETVFLGSDTMRRLIEQLVPEADFKRRSRFSALSYTGVKKISRIKPRSAIVGFSVEDVYAIAEVVRQRRGGAAVVLGALSPRTRNAQVSLYQNGDVDVLVATDAIGMGLNLDIDHVAFAGLMKFDGRRIRPLGSHEIGQIAGRAGRYRTPGTFGVTAAAEPLEPHIASAVEDSRFRPLQKLQWRNAELDFRSIAALLDSLAAPSDNPLLTRAREADDVLALRDMTDLAMINDRMKSPADVRLLWDVCQIPDFRKVSAADHSELLKAIFDFLQNRGRIPDDWLETQVRRIDRVDGDVDALSRRIAFMRTWTYVSQKVDWLEDAQYWRGRTRALEDRISDALHASLARRFVDRRVSVLMKQLKRKEDLVANVDEQGLLRVEGELIGRIEGFRFIQDETATVEEAKTLRQASAKVLAPEFAVRASRFLNAPNSELGLTEQGGLMWGEFAVGKLVAGKDKLAPDVEVFVDEEAGPETRGKVERRLRAFVSQKIATHCEALLALRDDETITGLARGIAYRIAESFGVLLRSAVAEDVKALDQETRKLLRAHGVRFGQHTIFLFSALKPEATRLRLLLWSLAEKLDEFPTAPPPGLVTIPVEDSAPDGYYPLSGFYRAGNRAIRIDMLDRLLNMLREQDGRAGFEATADMLSISGLSLEGFADLMTGIGYRARRGERVKRAAAEASGAKDEGTAPADSESDAADPASGEAKAAAVEISAAAAAGETSGETGKPEESPQSGEAPGPAVQDAEEEPETEVFFEFFWKPKPRFRSADGERKTAKRKRPEDRGSEQAARGKPGERRKSPRRPKPANKRRGAGQSLKGPPPRRQADRRKEKEADPDSPFAILAELKERIES